MTLPFERHMEISERYLRWRLGCSQALWDLMDSTRGRNVIRRWWNQEYGTSIPMEDEWLQ